MFSLTEQEAKYIEGYAKALNDVIYKLTGESPSNKSYDPMTCDAGEMHSYAFSMKDGGRHHPVSDYKNIDEILNILLEEGISWITDDFNLVEKEVE